MGGEQAVVLAKPYHTASPASEGEDVPSQAVERGPLELPVSAGSKGTLDN